LVQGSAIVIDIGPGDLTIIGIRDIRPQILFSKPFTLQRMCTLNSLNF